MGQCPAELLINNDQSEKIQLSQRGWMKIDELYFCPHCKRNYQ